MSNKSTEQSIELIIKKPRIWVIWDNGKISIGSIDPKLYAMLLKKVDGIAWCLKFNYVAGITIEESKTIDFESVDLRQSIVRFSHPRDHK